MSSNSSTSNSDSRSFAIRIFKITLAFWVPLILAFVGVEIRLARIPSVYSGKRDHFERESGNLQVLAMGSSHEAMGHDPSLWSVPGFNLALGSQTLMIDLELVEREIGNCPRLKLLILPFSFFTLELRLSDYVEVWRNAFFRRTWGIEGDFHDWRSRLDPSQNLLVFGYGFDRLRELIRVGFLAPWDGSVGAQGKYIGTWPPSQVLDPGNGPSRASFQLGKMKREYRSVLLAKAARVVELAHRRGVRVAFVTTPVFKTYLESMDQARWKENVDALNALCAQAGCSHADYLKDPRFLEADFQDADHLNQPGSRKFSEIIDREVISPNLRKTGH